MEKLFIPIVLGTARLERRSKQVASFVEGELQGRGDIETQIVDAREHAPFPTTPPWGTGGADEKPTTWKDIALRAEGFILVVPEYNRGYPGELKLLLDSLHNEYDKKPVMVCGVSTGMFGGRSLVEHIRPILLELKFVPMRGAFYAIKIKEMFNEKGELVDETNKERLHKQVEQLVWFARVLKYGRENL